MTLRPITKFYAGTIRQDGSGRVLRRECWSAITTDGKWAFTRIEEPGTPWMVTFMPHTDEIETATIWFGTLKSARQAVEHDIAPWLPSTQATAHERGEHVSGAPYGCRACGDARWAR